MLAFLESYYRPGFAALACWLESAQRLALVFHNTNHVHLLLCAFAQGCGDAFHSVRRLGYGQDVMRGHASVVDASCNSHLYLCLP